MADIVLTYAQTDQVQAYLSGLDSDSVYSDVTDAEVRQAEKAVDRMLTVSHGRDPVTGLRVRPELLLQWQSEALMEMVAEMVKFRRLMGGTKLTIGEYDQVQAGTSVVYGQLSRVPAEVVAKGRDAGLISALGSTDTRANYRARNIFEEARELRAAAELLDDSWWW